MAIKLTQKFRHTKKEVKKQIKEPSKEIRKTEDRVAKDLDPGEVIKF